MSSGSEGQNADKRVSACVYPPVYLEIWNPSVILAEFLVATAIVIFIWVKCLGKGESGKKIKIRGHRQGAGGYVDIDFGVTIGSKE